MPTVMMPARAIKTTYMRYQTVTIPAGMSIRATVATRRQSGTAAKLITALLLLLPALASAQTGTLAPVPQQVFLDNSGNPLSAGKVYTYLAGTTTPATTYSDSGLTTPNANPIILSSAGRATIYLSQSVNYKFVVKTSADATVYTQDNVASTLSSTVAATENGVCDGRITLTSGTAVTTSDVTAATTVYFTPFKGNRCALYNGTTWSITSFSQVSLSLGSDTANTNYDLFLYLSSGTPTLERVAWSTDLVRAVGVTLQDGVYVKATDTSRRYLGTYRTTGSAGQTEDSAAKRFVWNYRHRVLRTLRVTEATDSWTYTTSAFRQVNNSTANQVALVVGMSEVAVNLRAVGLATNGAATPSVSTGIGEDSTTTAVSGLLMQAGTAQSTVVASPNAQVVRFVVAGYHYYAWLESSVAAGTTTWYGDSGTPSTIQTGLTGFIEG